jgi:hypothetical protein
MATPAQFNYKASGTAASISDQKAFAYNTIDGELTASEQRASSFVFPPPLLFNLVSSPRVQWLLIDVYAAGEVNDRRRWNYSLWRTGRGNC